MTPTYNYYFFFKIITFLNSVFVDNVFRSIFARSLQDQPGCPNCSNTWKLKLYKERDKQLYQELTTKSVTTYKHICFYILNQYYFAFNHFKMLLTIGTYDGFTVR